MTPRPEANDPAGDDTVRCSADIDVELTKDSQGDTVFRFKAIDTLNVEVEADGVIHLLEWVGPNERAELSFTFSGGSGEVVEVQGVQIGTSETDVIERPVVVDTLEEYYLDTPFKVANQKQDEKVTTLLLTQVGGLMPPEINPYFYVLSALQGGRVFRHDPKIYNKGDGGWPPGGGPSPSR